MDYLLSRVHKLYALSEALERYVTESNDINVYTIEADANDILTVAEDIVNYEMPANFKKAEK